MRHNILIGIPMFTKMSAYPLTLELTDDLGQARPIAANVQVISGGYGRQTIKIADSELLAPAVEEEEISLLAHRNRQASASERTWADGLSLPASRAHQRRLWHVAFLQWKSFQSLPRWRGLRWRAWHVDPWRRPMATVVMVDRLQIRGNTTVIDHGWGLFTLYAHQDETLVALRAPR